jgi:hypothetical protein
MPKAFFTKRDLVAEIQARNQEVHEALIVSEDVPERDQPGVFKGKKKFWLCSGPEEYVKLLETGNHLNEVLPDRFKTACYVYMDVDEACEGDETVKDRKTHAYVRKVLNAFSIGNEHVGKSVQVLTSHTPTKVSIHILVNIRSCPAEVLGIMGMVSKTVPWDESVYSMFRSFRAINQSKGGKPYKLRPWGQSSMETRDHIVRILPGDTRMLIELKDRIARQIQHNTGETSWKCGQKRIGSKNRSTNNEEESKMARDELMRDLQCTGFLKSIKAPDIESALGRASRRDFATFVYVNSGFTCLFKKEPHRSNNGYLMKDCEGNITYKCLSPKCFGKSYVVTTAATRSTKESEGARKKQRTQH